MHIFLGLSELKFKELAYHLHVFSKNRTLFSFCSFLLFFLHIGKVTNVPSQCRDFGLYVGYHDVLATPRVSLSRGRARDTPLHKLLKLIAAKSIYLDLVLQTDINRSIYTTGKLWSGPIEKVVTKQS